MEINLEFNTNDYNQEDLGVIFKEILKLEELLRDNKINKTEPIKEEKIKLKKNIYKNEQMVRKFRDWL